MAGSPTANPNPGSVTFPTPFPCRKCMPGESEKIQWLQSDVRG